jgi:hypothetical protein
MGIFPFLDIPPESLKQGSVTTNLPLYQDYAWDFVLNEPVLVNGDPVLLSGNEALKVWIYKALKTQRYRYLAHSWNFGNELEDQLLGSSLSAKAKQAEAERLLRETLFVSPYIKGVQNVAVTTTTSDVLQVSCTVITIYGEVNVNA